MAARVQRRLGVAPDAAFAAFCDVESIPAWVAPVCRVDVVARRPDGRPLEVVFEARGEGGTEVRYSLRYSYDLRGRRVMWWPHENPTAAVRGVVEFTAEPGGCSIVYTIDIADAWADDHAKATALANDVVEAFAAWLVAGGGDPHR